MIPKYDIELHNEIRWLIEDYVGEFDLKIELVDRIIEKIKEAVNEDVAKLETQNKQMLDALVKTRDYKMIYEELDELIISITGKKPEEL